MNPQRVGQSADVVIAVGQVATLQAEFIYADEVIRTVPRKVRSMRPGRFVVTIAPPVDTQNDPTECIDAEPAIFVVDVVPS